MYITYYSIYTWGSQKDCLALDKYIEEEVKKGTFDGFVDDLFLEGTVEGRWSSMAEDMEKISKANPNVLFQIEGSGEEVEDLWKERWKDGEHERIDIGWPPFTNPNLFLEGVD